MKPKRCIDCGNSFDIKEINGAKECSCQYPQRYGRWVAEMYWKCSFFKKNDNNDLKETEDEKEEI